MDLEELSPNWFLCHMGTMWSTKETKLLGRKGQGRTDDVLVDLKMEIKDMFLAAAGLKPNLPVQKARLFSFCTDANELLQLFILVSPLRLDASKRTILLDAVAIPHHGEVLGNSPLMDELKKVASRGLLHVYGFTRADAAIETCTTSLGRALQNLGA